MRLWIFKLWTLLENFMHQVMYLMCKWWFFSKKEEEQLR
jgi:hypothetical protein